MININKRQLSTRPKRLKAGFTLVELLVVVGIISVLVAILLPALNSARQQAQVVQCLSNVRQLGLGLVMYAGENRGWYPPESLSIPLSGSPPTYIGPDARHLTYYLFGDVYTAPTLTRGRYVASRKVFYCPPDYTHGEATCEFPALGFGGEGTWPLRIGYNYFENPYNRSQTWDINPQTAVNSPTTHTAAKNPDMIILYDNASWWGNVTPVFIHHLHGSMGAINYNSTGGSIVNALCFDGSAHSLLISYQYAGGTFATVPAKLP